MKMMVQLFLTKWYNICKTLSIKSYVSTHSLKEEIFTLLMSKGELPSPLPLSLFDTQLQIFVFSNGCKTQKNGFGRWVTTHLLHDASIDFFVNEAFWQHQCIMIQGTCGGSCIVYYTTICVSPKCKIIFFAKKRKPHKSRHLRASPN